MRPATERGLAFVEKLYLAAITLIGLAWILDLPRLVDGSLIAAEWIGLLLGIAVAASLLRHPYSDRTRVPDLLLGLLAIACWLWMALHYSDWIIDIRGYTTEKVIPAVMALLLLMEGMRQLDEMRRLGDNLPALRSRMSVAFPLRKPLRDASPDELDVIQLALNHNTLADMMNHSGRPDPEVAELVVALLEKGYLTSA